MNNGNMICSNCGKPLSPNDRFCGRCGTPNAYFNNGQINETDSNNTVNQQDIVPSNMNIPQNNPNPFNSPNNVNNSMFNNSTNGVFNWMSILPVIFAFISWFAMWWLSVLGFFLSIALLADFKNKNHRGADFVLTIVGMAACGGLILFLIYAISMR